jgi:ubiquinone/menaquinone biosynthesis C-methylase UbiE
MTPQEPKRDPKKAERRALQPYLPGPKDRVLDIGCGDGRLTWLFAHGAALAAGIDIDLEELGKAPGARPGPVPAAVCFAAAASETMPFANESFDLAIFTWSL